MRRLSFLALGALPCLLNLNSCGNESSASEALAAAGATENTNGSTATNRGGTGSAAARGGASASGGNKNAGGAPQSGGASAGGGGARSEGGTPTVGGAQSEGGAASEGGASAGGARPRPPQPWASTEFGRADTDVATIQAAPSASFYIGGWTHTVEPLNFVFTGNDYPFVVPCKETVAGTGQLILMVSGNIAYDEGYGSWYYNQNITTNTGDYSTIYAHTGQFGYPAGEPDEAGIRGWVYVAWHYRPTPSGTAVSQYLKFGTGGLVLLTEDVIDGTGGWSGPTTPVNELASPKSISVGGGPRGWAQIYMQFVKVYEFATAPTKDQVSAIALRTEPDPTAWADWPLIGADLSDVSGHGRHLTAVDGNGRKGTLYPARVGPKF